MGDVTHSRCLLLCPIVPNPKTRAGMVQVQFIRIHTQMPKLKADTELPILFPLLIQENLYEELVSFHIKVYTKPKILLCGILTNSSYNKIAPTGLLHLSYKKKPCLKVKGDAFS